MSAAWHEIGEAQFVELAQIECQRRYIEGS
jgi:hypothetical protein